MGGRGYASGFSFSFFFEEGWGCDFEARGWRDAQSSHACFLLLAFSLSSPLAFILYFHPIITFAQSSLPPRLTTHLTDQA